MRLPKDGTSSNIRVYDAVIGELVRIEALNVWDGIRTKKPKVLIEFKRKEVI